MMPEEPSSVILSGSTMTDVELRDYRRRAKRIAQPAGPMHDAIFDAEGILAGQPSLQIRSAIEAQFLGYTWPFD
jgi:hypothetical protein